ncbi:MAG: methyltransferase domain-containing protein [Candidatus Zixiibacteriota bacterium]
MARGRYDYEYLLGHSDAELDRLRFQHTVWGPVTRKFFDRLGVAEGWKCLDVGAGPGFVSLDLRERVGDSGEITALEPSELYRDWFRQEVEREGWSNVRILGGTSYDADLPRRHYNLVFVRWVISFVPDPKAFLIPLLDALTPGGIIALQDYVHEGCLLFPTGGPWDRMPEAIRAWWRAGGGDPYVAARLPAVMRNLGLKLIDYTPNCLSGGPDSSVMEWMGRFLKSQVPVMVEKRILTASEAEAMEADWSNHIDNPDTRFFSPLVVDVAGRS